MGSQLSSLSGGFLGIGERLIAIPIDHLKLENGKFVLKGATKEVRKAMPPFHYADRTT